MSDRAIEPIAGDDLKTDDGWVRNLCGKIVVTARDPGAPDAVAMSDALWQEVQRRYDFVAPNPYDPEAFRGAVGRLWVAAGAAGPIGSIAISALEPGVGELDVMYVDPAHRGTGVAQALLDALEQHARAVGIHTLRLRAGLPQPEALRFYAKAGFTAIAPFGRWVGDETARCYEKVLFRPTGERMEQRPPR